MDETKDELKIVVKTADGTRKAEVAVSADQRVKEIVQAAIDNWALPKDTDYTVFNVSTSKLLKQSQTLKEAGVSNSDILEIQPVLVAGAD